MGYSSTAQLSATLDGDALISTKAVIELVKNFNVNPTYLFTGQGPMFMAEKDEIDELKGQISQLEKVFVNCPKCPKSCPKAKKPP